MKRKNRQESEDVAKLVRSVGRRELSEERWAALEERIVHEIASWDGRSAARMWGKRVWMGVVERWRRSVTMVGERSRIVVPAIGIAVLCVIAAWVTKNEDSGDRGMLRTDNVRGTRNVRWTTYSLYSSSAHKEPVSLYSVGKAEYVR